MRCTDITYAAHLLSSTPPRLTRSLLRRSRQGALATLMASSGDPYCSLVNVASHADGSPIPADFAPGGAYKEHPRRFQGIADARRAARRRPAGGSRIMLAGRAEQAGTDDLPVLRRRYLNAHPSAETFVNF
jgi:hypothetical protein